MTERFARILAKTVLIALVPLSTQAATRRQAAPLPTDLQPIAADAVPRRVTQVWSMQYYGIWPPLPRPHDLSGQVLYWSPSLQAVFLDDAQVDYEAREADARSANGMLNEGTQTDTPEYPPGSLSLRVLAVTNGIIWLGVCGLTNDTTCEILSREALSDGNWLSEGSLVGTNDECTLTLLSIGGRTNVLFLTARTPADPSGTLPMDWQWKYFGQTGVDRDGDYDADNVSNLDEYLGGTDPNQVTFTFRLGYGHFNSTQATCQFEVVAGVPSFYAVLVNSTNWSGATWNTYDGTAPFTLGPTDGVYQVMCGLKGRASDSRPTWLGTSVVLDREPPAVVITCLDAVTVTKPYVQVKGYSVEPLLSVSCCLSNAAGVQTNLMCLLTGAAILPTNSFQVFDVPLTNGPHLISLRVMDLAGNVTTTNLNCTLDYSGQTSGPAIGIYWPQDGALIASDRFALRGWLDDETASITAQIVGGDGTTNQVAGLVERDGRLWIEDLPLTSGTNYLTITANNAAGYSSGTTLALVRSDVTVTIDEVPQDELNQLTTVVSGTTSDDNYKVWVNGVGVLPTNGVWTARHVPVPPGGTAIFAVTLIPLSDNGGEGSQAGSGYQSDSAGLNRSTGSTVASTSSSPQGPGDPVGLNPASPGAPSSASTPEKEAAVRMVEGNWSGSRSGGSADWLRIYGSFNSSFSETNGFFRQDAEFDGPVNGASQAFGSLFWKYPDGYELGVWWEVHRAGDGTVNASTNVVEAPGWPVAKPLARGSLSGSYFEDPIFYADASRFAEVKMVLSTGGKSGVGRQNLFSCSGWAREVYLNQHGGFVERPNNVPPEGVFVPAFGRSLGSDGRAYGVLPDNEELEITPLVARPYYVFDINPSKHKLTIKANGRDCETEFLFADPPLIVGQKVKLEAEWDWPPPSMGVETNQWHLDGIYVNSSTQRCAACSVDYTNNPLLLRNDPTYAWWVSGGGGLPDSYSVKLEKGLTFDNGQHVDLTREGSITMLRPLPAFSSPVRDTVRVDTNLGVNGQIAPGWRLQFGRNTPGTNIDVGIAFAYASAPVDPTTASPFGRYFITQVISAFRQQYNEWNGTNCVGTQLDGSGLDSENPYQGYLEGDHGERSDSPGGGLTTARWLTMSGSFRTYLMFEPAGGIGVPMYEVDWAWSGTARTNGQGG